MESKYYICKYINSCLHVGNRHCAFGGAPILKDYLDKLCGGSFKPQYTIRCDHPHVQNGIFLIPAEHSYAEGNYHTIWPQS